MAEVFIKSHLRKSCKEVTLRVLIISGAIKEITSLDDFDISEDSLDVVELPSIYRETEEHYKLAYPANSECTMITECPVERIETDIFRRKVGELEEGQYKAASSTAEIGKIIIPEGITYIAPTAFAWLNVDTVVWPKSCKVISERCFFGSAIKRFEGIECVELIRHSAFEKNFVIEEFNWPQGCRKIPQDCFSECKSLTKITGIEDVEKVGYYAFSYTKSLKHIDWPENCSKILECCFCGSGIESVKFFGEHIDIEQDAFIDSNIRELDFSESVSCNIEDEKVVRNKVKILYPYYQTF